MSRERLKPEDLALHSFFMNCDPSLKDMFCLLSDAFLALNAKLAPGGFILDKVERELLKLIPVTTGEARQIMLRNAGLLDLILEEGGEIKRDVGCPHCRLTEDGVFDCDTCAWRNLSSYIRGSIFCGGMTFGGYKLEDVNVFLSCDSEWMDLSDSELIDPSIIFIWGHVEWAGLVLTGEIEPAATSYRKWNEKDQQEWLERSIKSIRKLGVCP